MLQKIVKIVVLDTGYRSYEYEEKLFISKGYDFQIYNGSPDDITAKINIVRDADGILVRSTHIDKSFLDEMKNLKAIVRYGVGYDNIDLDEATRRGIRVANVQGYANHAVSDHALALLYSCVRALPSGMQKIREQFGNPPLQDLFELHDKTLGIIGLGRIGSHFSKKANGLFNKILATDPYITDEVFIRCRTVKTDLHHLLSESHVISIHCNLTDETHHLLDESAFGRMNKRPVIINTARGPIIDEEALYQALIKGKIHSAGLDVWEDELVSPRQEKILDHPMVVATGHYAWYSDRSSAELQQRAAMNMIRLLNGESFSDCLNC